MHKKNGFISLMLLALLLCSFAVSAFADSPLPDLDRKDGAIAITVKDSTGKVVPGGSLTIYRVANAVYNDANQEFVLTDDFSGCGVQLSSYVKPTAGSDHPTIAVSEQLIEKFDGYARKNKISGTEKEIGTNGKLTFDGLSMGLYLVAQTEGAKQYTTINSFLVSLPGWNDKKGEWVYTVDASPKVGTVSPVPTDPTTEPTTAPTTTPPTTKPTTSTTPSTGNKIPQTGHAWLPVWVLTAAGLTLVVIGGRLRRKESQDAA